MSSRIASDPDLRKFARQLSESQADEIRAIAVAVCQAMQYPRRSQSASEALRKLLMLNIWICLKKKGAIVEDACHCLREHGFSSRSVISVAVRELMTEKRFTKHLLVLTDMRQSYRYWSRRYRIS